MITAKALAKSAAPFMDNEQNSPALWQTHLEQSAIKDPAGKDTLRLQAELLDSLFSRLLLKAMSKKDLKGNDVPDYINKDHIRLALRAQRQCRATLDTFQKLSTPDKETKK